WGAIEIKGEPADGIATATGGARNAARQRRRSSPDARPRRARLAATGRQRGNPGTHRPERRVPLAALGGRARCHRFSDVRTARPAWLSGRTLQRSPDQPLHRRKAMTLSLAHLQPLVALIA